MNFPYYIKAAPQHNAFAITIRNAVNNNILVGNHRLKRQENLTVTNVTTLHHQTHELVTGSLTCQCPEVDQAQVFCWPERSSQTHPSLAHGVP